MKIYINITLVLSLFITLGCAQKAKTPADAKNAATEAVAVHLKNQVEAFVKVTEPNRTVGEVGHKAAVEWIKARFEKIASTQPSAKVYVHKFTPDVKFAKAQYQKDFDTEVAKQFKKTSETYKKWEQFTKASKAFISNYAKFKGQNIILEIKGKSKPSEVITIGAHYDTITHNHETMVFTPQAKAPGADDNASALVVMLELAERYARVQPERTLRFVAFDFEELFFLGSYALAKDISKGKFKKEKNIGLINLEMLGWSTKTADSKSAFKIYTRSASDKNHLSDMKLANVVQQNTSPELLPMILNNGFNRSDNWSYWQFKLPAICVTQDWESDFNEANYHTDHDLPATLNYKYMSQLTETLDRSIQSLLSSQ